MSSFYMHPTSSVVLWAIVAKMMKTGTAKDMLCELHLYTNTCGHDVHDCSIHTFISAFAPLKGTIIFQQIEKHRNIHIFCDIS